MKKLLMLLMVLSSVCFAKNKHTYKEHGYWDQAGDDRDIWRSANDSENEKITGEISGSPADAEFRKYWIKTCDQAGVYKHRNSQAKGWLLYMLYCHHGEPDQFVFLHYNKDKWDVISLLPHDTTTTAAAKGIPLEFWDWSNPQLGPISNCGECDFHGKFLKDAPPVRYKTVKVNHSFLVAEDVKGIDGLNKILKKIDGDRIKYILTDKQDKDGDFFYKVIYRTEKIKEVQEEIPY